MHPRDDRLAGRLNVDGSVPLTWFLKEHFIPDRLAGLLDSQREIGRSAGTCAKTRQNLLRVGRYGHECGVLTEAPFVSKITARSQRPVPWTIGETERILASARSMPGDVAGIPARVWWPALLLTILDTESTATEALTTPISAYDPKRGRITVGLLVYLCAETDVQHAQQSLGHSSKSVTLADIDPTIAPRFVDSVSKLPRPAWAG